MQVDLEDDGSLSLEEVCRFFFRVKGEGPQQEVYSSANIDDACEAICGPSAEDGAPDRVDRESTPI